MNEDDSRRHTALARLQARYGEARELASFSAEHDSNLDWILGSNRSESEPPADLHRKMIPLLALWLEDLAVELESGLASRPPGETDESTALAQQACKSAAATLREATEGFAAAHRRSV